MKNIDIWIASFKKLSFLASKISCLSDKEHHRANKFHFIKDKMHYELSHVFLRHILHTYYSHISPSEWQFSLAKHGKPYILNKLTEPLNFTLSKSENMVAIAFSKDYDIGIDIEKVAELPTTDFYNLVFTNHEKELLHSSRHNEKEAFYTLWTLKEAYIKAMGTGFSYDPTHIDLSGIAIKLRTTNKFYKTPDFYYSNSFENNIFSIVALDTTDKIKINFKNF